MSDSDSFTSSSYTSYSDSFTYSDGSLTDSSDFDLLLATPDRATRPVQSTVAKENNPEENKQDEEPVECARQFMDTSSNDLELITEAEALEIPAKSLKSENMPIELPAQISIEFDPPFSSAANSTQKLVQEAESSESQSEIVPSIEVRPPSPPLTSISPVSNDAQTTSSTSQGFLSIDSGVRLRSSSQDSHHSVPKSWSDFESEAKTWKPVKVAAPKLNTKKETKTMSQQDSEPEMSQSSEGYRSSAEIDHEVDKIIADTFKIPLIPKEKKERNIIERPRRNIDDFVRSAISLSDNCTKHVTERKKERIPSVPAEISEIPRCTSDSGHSDSSLRAEPQHVEKIIRVKLIQSGDKLTYGYLPSGNEIKTKRSDSLDSSKSIVSTASTQHGLKSAARQATVKRRDTFTRNFDKLEKSALQGVEKIYQAHQSRAQQLLIDLQISMAKNGFGKYRPQPIRNTRASDTLLITEV